MRSTFTLLAITSIFIAGCGEDDTGSVKETISLDDPAVDIHYDESYQFELTHEPDKKDQSYYTWKSSDEYVATVNQKGIVEGSKVGETMISVESQNGLTTESKVTVVPYSTMCEEPVFEFGQSKEKVRQSENRVFQAEADNMLLFEGENYKIRNCAYLFEDGKMTGAILLLADNEAVIEESAQFFSERYIVKGEISGMFMFSNDKGLTIGLTYDDDLGFVALYTYESEVDIQSVISSFKHAKGGVIVQ